MKQVDWSKAPADAQAYMPHSSYWYEGWWKREGTQSYFCEINDAKWQASNAKPWGLHGMVERPKAQGWTGTELPPAGTVCEALWNESRDEWFTVKVFGVNEHGQPIHRWEEGPKKYEYQASPLRGACGTYYFRPIRTPEQIAAEEREKAVEAMLSLDPYLPNTTLGMMSRADFCRALHDAGYRKQEKPQ